MQSITHEEQQERWEKEHQTPTVLLQMDSRHASSGVKKFATWMQDQGASFSDLKGLEVCCGKGRNVIWCAQQGIAMTGLDFSQSAIAEAKKRAAEVDETDKATFYVHDVTLPFPVDDSSLDFAFDCFGSTDIESLDARKKARDNVVTALKQGGYFMVYLLSTDDEFHKQMIAAHPGPDEGSFIHPTTGKYEKAFTEDEVKQFYSDLTLVTLERIPKVATFADKQYNCNHIWAVFQKPIL